MNPSAPFRQAHPWLLRGRQHRAWWRRMMALHPRLRDRQAALLRDRQELVILDAEWERRC